MSKHCRDHRLMTRRLLTCEISVLFCLHVTPFQSFRIVYTVYNIPYSLYTVLYGYHAEKWALEQSPSSYSMAGQYGHYICEKYPNFRFFLHFKLWPEEKKTPFRSQVETVQTMQPSIAADTVEKKLLTKAFSLLLCSSSIAQLLIQIFLFSF